MRFCLLLLGIFLLAGCGEVVEGEDDPSPEILRMPDECIDKSDSEMEECCEEVCIEYCQDEGFVYFRSVSAEITCPCWCTLE